MSEVANVVVSVKPEYARAIAAGKKTVELRRRFPNVQPGAWLILYATLPMGVIVGKALIEAVEHEAPSDIWARHGGAAQVSKGFFDQYYAGRTQGVAVRLGAFIQFGPLSMAEVRAVLPDFRPPQSYRYLGSEVLKQLEHQDAPPTASSSAV